MNRMKRDANYLGNLADYVKKNLGKGYTLESLKWALISQGHSRLEVDKAMKLAQGEMAREAPVLKTPPQPPQEILNIQVEPEPKQGFWKNFFS